MHTRRAVKTKLKLQLKDDANNNDVFKVRLDKFWAQQEVMFGWVPFPRKSFPRGAFPRSSFPRRPLRRRSTQRAARLWRTAP